MLSSCSFARGIARVDRCVVHSIGGEEWFGVSKDGKGMLFTTGSGSSPTPPDFLLMTVGACAGDDVNYVLQKNNRDVKGVHVEIEGEWAPDLPRRFKEVRLRFKCDAPGVSKDDVARVADTVVSKLCPVANTLVGKPHLHAKASILKSDE